MKPYYELTDENKSIIYDLISTCEKHNLSCAGLQLYTSPTINFFISKTKNDWKLVVKHEKQNRCQVYFSYSDVYRIINTNNEAKITYEYSDSDIV